MPRSPAISSSPAISNSPAISSSAALGPCAGSALAGRRRTAWALAGGVGAMSLVGSSTAVSGILADAPLFTAQALRYAVACLVLLLSARLTGRRIAAPRGRQWLWLAGIAATGLVLFNIALVRGASHAEPAVLGVAVACVPIVLAVGGTLRTGGRPGSRLLVSALAVTLGAALVQGLGRSDVTGIAWAGVVFACEAAFTLLALPVLGPHGPWGVSVHTTWLAAAMFGVLALLREGATGVAKLDVADLAATGYLAFAVTALAFVLWYGCVNHLGPGRAGLITGVAPVAAAAAGVALGAPAPGPAVWVGVATVAAGLALGLTARTTVR